MVTISIAALIYRSKRYADWVHDSIHEFTPHLNRGEAEFFFVANDPTEDLLKHLQEKGYKHYVNRNPKRTEEELFKMGYGAPEYIHRVYRGWNRAIELATGEVVVLLNSDNYVSPDWLENLLKYLSSKTVVCSKLVEPYHLKHGGVFPGAYHCEFGRHPDDFDREAFLQFCERAKTTGLQLGGAYMPCTFYKRFALEVGLYPEGNLARKSFSEVSAYGDQVFFQRLEKLGLRHVTAADSLVYHTQEGEMIEPNGHADEARLAGASAGKKLQSEWPCAFPVLPVAMQMDGDVEYLSLRGWTWWIASSKKSLARLAFSGKTMFLGMGAAIVARLPRPLANTIRAVWHHTNAGKA